MLFALQYIAAAENNSKISYRTPQEEHRAQCSSRRIKSKQGIPDTSAKFGPPDKNEHFTSPLDSDDDFDLPPPSKKVKEGEEDRRDVEVLYSDGVWYKGWLSSFLLKHPFLTRK